MKECKISKYISVKKVLSAKNFKRNKMIQNGTQKTILNKTNSTELDFDNNIMLVKDNFYIKFKNNYNKIKIMLFLFRVYRHGTGSFNLELINENFINIAYLDKNDISLKINKNKNDISSNLEKINTNENDISSNLEKINTNEEAISSNLGIINDNISNISSNAWGGGGVQPHFCPWKNVCFPIFPMGKNGEKSIWKEREMNTFPSLSIYFFPIFPMGKKYMERGK